MSKFTPGPWHVERDEEQYPFKAFVDDNNGVSADDGRNYYLATVEHGSSSELTANANLIAAAPEMYEALKACRLQMLQSNNHSEYAQEANDMARAALAKADGGQQ